MAKDKVVVEILAETKKAVSNMAKFAAGVGAALVAVRSIQKVIKGSVEAYLKQERAVTKLEAALQATGNTVGITSLEMQQMAREMSSVTGIADEAIIEAQGLMTTFTQIGNEVFPQAVSAAADMSAMFGQDLQQSVIQLGTALNDPIQGIGRLRRIGISFTDEQRESIRAFMEQNDVMSAQGVILDELRREFGGVAKELGESNVMALEKLKNAFGDLQEVAGEKFLTEARPVIDWLTSVAENAVNAERQLRAAEDAVEAMSAGEAVSNVEDATAGLLQQRQEIDQRIRSLQSGGGRGNIQAAIRRAEQERAALTAQISALQQVEAWRQRGKDAAEAQAAAAAKADREQAQAAAELAKKVEDLSEAYAKTSEGKIEEVAGQIRRWEAALSDSRLPGEQVKAVLEDLREEYEKLTAPAERAADAVEKFNKVPGYASAVERLEATGDAVRELEENTLDLSRALVSGFGDMTQAILDGENATKEFAKSFLGMIAQMLDALSQAALAQGLFKIGLASLGPAASFAAATAASVAAGVVRGMAGQIEMAEGGLINEPVVGLGQNTGRRYLLGEAGPEYVVPQDKMGGGMTIIQNIQGNVVTEEEMYRRADEWREKAYRRY